MKTIPVITVLLVCCFGYGQHLDQHVANPSFEMDPGTGIRPPYWYIGQADSPPTFTDSGQWELDLTNKSSGNQSLKLTPNSTSGYFLTQIVDVPIYNLKGKTISVGIDMRNQGLAGDQFIIVYALNTTLPPDPVVGAGVAGKVFIVADKDQPFKRYEGEFTATDNASLIQVLLAASGNTGAAWFDSISVVLDVVPPDTGPGTVPSPISERNFMMGLRINDPVNFSEKAQERVEDSAALYAEAVNIFLHTRWCGLTGEDPATAHRIKLNQARAIKDKGLKYTLTYDFTQASPEGIGDLNPMPDGTPVTSLNDSTVANACKYELLALCSLETPDYVVVGIEMSTFHDRHLDQWDSYVRMFKSISAELNARFPVIHVTAYFTLDWMVNPDVSIDSTHMTAWQKLLPELESIGYSTYPGTFGWKDKVPPPGYFIKAVGVAPGLPLFLPEFGIVGNDTGYYDQDRQAQVLTQILTEFEPANVELAHWYSPYDNDLLGAPDWYRNAFSHIGMIEMDETPKKSWEIWKSAVGIPYGIAVQRPGPGGPVKDFSLNAYPNPFNSAVVISMAATGRGGSRPAPTVLAIYDIHGRIMERFTNTHIPFTWNASRYPAGTYIINIITGTHRLSRKIVLKK